MTRSQMEQWQTPDAPNSPPAENPATAAAITLVPQGSLEPAPRPRWQKRLALGAKVGAVGGLAGLIWWFLLRTPARPFVLDISPSASQYAVTAQQSPLVNWQISHPRQVDTLVLRTLAADGTLVGEAQRYDLTGSLPLDLLAYCTQTRARLTCENVPTDIRQPGQYQFELTLLPKAGLNQPPVEATSSLVTITDRPMPMALELAPSQVIYSEMGTQVSANTPTLAPPVTPNGIQLNWIVTHPEALQDLLLVVRKPDGGSLGGRRFSLRDPENPTRFALPEELEPFCQVGRELVCQGVPTGMAAVGQYRFELTPIPVGGFSPEDTPVGKVSETVEIQPRPVRIAAFMVNGREAEPKYLVPVEPGQSIPGFRLDWQVEGGSTTKVEILPSPGSVGLAGTLNLPLPPTGTTTITLRVTDGQNPPILRAVTFETFNPNPNPPIILQQPAPPAPQGSTGSANPNPAPPAASGAQTPAPPPPRPEPQRELPGRSLQEAQSEGTPPTTLPDDLRHRTPEDLNLRF